MRQKITGIAAHSKYSGFYRNYPWISSGANLTCTILWLSLQWLNFELPPTIYLQVRLCCRSLLFIIQTMASSLFQIDGGSENWNKTVFGFCALLVKTGLVAQVQIIYCL